MNSQNDTMDALLDDLLESTREALQAARIEHHSALIKALARRGQVIARIWGLKPDEPLPDFSVQWAENHRPMLTDNNRMVVEKVKDMEVNLQRALNAQNGRLVDQQRQLNRGRRFANSMREHGGQQHVQRLDTIG